MVKLYFMKRKKSERGGSLQILLGPLLANILDQIVIYDFRSKDIASGGHGALLVALVDEALAGRLYGWRGVLILVELLILLLFHLKLELIKLLNV